MVDGVELHLITDINRGLHRLGIRLPKNSRHLGRALHPLLLRVAHAFRVIEVLTRREANQAVMRLGMLLIDKVHVIRTDGAHMVLGRQITQIVIHLELHGVGLVVGIFDRCPMQLQFEVIILAKEILVPANRLIGSFHIIGRNGTRHLSGQTRRTTNQPFVVFLQLRAVGTRAHIETLGPCFGDNLNQVVVTRFILGQQDEVIATLVGFSLLILQSTASHIDLTTDNWLKSRFLLPYSQFLLLCRNLGIQVINLLRTIAQGRQTSLTRLDTILAFTLDLLHIVEELLLAKHVTMIRQGNTGLAIGHSLIYQALNRRLAIENRVLRMDVQVDKLGHSCSLLFLSCQRYNNSSEKRWQASCILSTKCLIL